MEGIDDAGDALCCVEEVESRATCCGEPCLALATDGGSVEGGGGRVKSFGEEATFCGGIEVVAPVDPALFALTWTGNSEFTAETGVGGRERSWLTGARGRGRDWGAGGCVGHNLGIERE